MTTVEMAAGLLRLAVARADVLHVFHDARSWATVVREGQEAVELFLKAALRHVGAELRRRGGLTRLTPGAAPPR